MKKRIAFILLLSMFTLLMLSGCGKSKPTASNKADATNNVAVSDGNVISGTGVLQPVDTYTISASVMGDVLSANFEEGQIVKQGDVLYSIDQSDLKANIDKASIAIERSELAVKQTSDNIAKQTVKAKTSGTVTKMYVSKGATIAIGTPVCDIVNDEQMILRVPFLVENAQNIFVGEPATVPLVGTYYTLNGSV
ncbi:MAG: biotin/lipoyl-binding protein, partial [Bacteroidota bacterium]|nr:biotin/lipoyl-binding protein [Bacteroidota bacterium]